MALNFYRKLYAIERNINTMSPEDKYRIRQEESIPVWEKFVKRMELKIGKTPPKTALGIALNYAYKLRDRLRYYCNIGCLPMSNEKAENAIEPFIVEWKNFLFYDSPKGAAASANLYGLIMTAIHNGLNPFDYLVDVFKHLPLAQSVEDVEKLSPWNLSREQINTIQSI